MSKHWVLAAAINPDKLDGTVSGRFGASIMFVAYRKVLRQWLWIFPGGEERIEMPEMLFLDKEWAMANRQLTRDRPPRRENPFRIHKTKSDQLQLFEKTCLTGFFASA